MASSRINAVLATLSTTAFIVFILGMLWAFNGPLPLSKEKAATVLAAGSFEDVQLGGVAFMRCPEDTFSRTFVAKINGSRVSGAVCAGWIKGAYVRVN